MTCGEGIHTRKRLCELDGIEKDDCPGAIREDQKCGLTCDICESCESTGFTTEFGCSLSDENREFTTDSAKTWEECRQQCDDLNSKTPGSCLGAFYEVHKDACVRFSSKTKTDCDPNRRNLYRAVRKCSEVPECLENGT